MNRTIKIASGALIVGVALICLGVWRLSPAALLSDVALPDPRSGQSLERDGVSVALDVKQGVFRWWSFFVFSGLLFVPFGLVWWHAYTFHKRRWENSNVMGTRSYAMQSAGTDDDDDD